MTNKRYDDEREQGREGREREKDKRRDVKRGNCRVVYIFVEITSCVYC